MGTESGLEFVQWVREKGNEAKVVFLTSYAEFSYAQKAIALKSAEYLLKPVKFARMAEDDVYTGDVPQFLADYEYKEIVYKEPSFSLWETMLLEGKSEEMLRELERYLGHLQLYGTYNSKILKCFLEDFQQMIYVVLRKRNITMSKLLERPDKEEVNLAVHSIAHMKAYSVKQAKRAVSGMNFVAKEESVVETVKKYMADHLGEDLSREDFAAQVYLNGDYLARIFKKETGMSLGNYLQKVRMLKARQLLYETKKPVNVENDIVVRKSVISMKIYIIRKSHFFLSVLLYFTSYI